MHMRTQFAREPIGDRGALSRRLALVVGLALVILTAGFAGSAFAAVAALQRVPVTSVTDSNSPKSATAICPTGKQRLGGGSHISGGGGQVVIDQFSPASSVNQVSVTGQEDGNGYAGSWSVTAYVICATPVIGVQRVDAISSSNSNTTKSISATCPSGKKVLGAGGSIGNGAGQVVLDAIRPNSTLTSVTTRGVEDENGYANSWVVRAIAICATPVAGLELLANTSATGSVTATCPLGKQVVGAGGEISSGGNGQVVIDDLIPNSALTNVTVAGVEDETGNPNNWAATAYAICAASSRRVVATSATNSNTSKSATANCPAGQQFTGIGGHLAGGGTGQVSMDAIRPQDSTTSVLVGAKEDETGTAANWSVSADAICVTAPIPGREVVSDASGFDSVDKSAGPHCSSGKNHLSGAGQILGGNGQVVIENMALLGAGLVGVWGVEDANGYAGNWSVTGYAICATSPPGFTAPAVLSDQTSSNKTVPVSCPPGKNLWGVGYQINTSEEDRGKVMIDDLLPSATLKSVSVAAVEAEGGTNANWSVYAWATCANP